MKSFYLSGIVAWRLLSNYPCGQLSSYLLFNSSLTFYSWTSKPELSHALLPSGNKRKHLTLLLQAPPALFGCFLVCLMVAFPPHTHLYQPPGVAASCDCLRAANMDVYWARFPGTPHLCSQGCVASAFLVATVWGWGYQGNRSLGWWLVVVFFSSLQCWICRLTLAKTNFFRERGERAGGRWERWESGA